MSYKETTASVIGLGPTALPAADLALAGVRGEVIDRLVQPDRGGPRPAAGCEEPAGQSIATTCLVTRSSNDGPDRGDVNGALRG